MVENKGEDELQGPPPLPVGWVMWVNDGQKWDGSWRLASLPEDAPNPIQFGIVLYPSGPTSAPTWTLRVLGTTLAAIVARRCSPPPFEAANAQLLAWDREGRL